MTAYAISCVEWAQELSGFGMLDGDKLPDMSLDTWEPILAEQGDFVGSLEERGVPMNLTRSDTHRYPDEVPGIINRTAVRRWSADPDERIPTWYGQIKLRIPAYTIGAGGVYSPYLDYWLHQMLGTSMASDVPTVETDAVAVIGTATSHTATAGLSFSVGRGIACLVDNALEFSTVTNKVGNVITNSPAWSRALVLAETVRHCQTLYRARGTSLPTGALRFVWEGRLYASFGCRVSEVALSWADGAAFLDLTFDPAVTLRDDTAAVLTSWTEPGGDIVQFMQGGHAISTNTIGTTVPAALARTALALHSWSAVWRFGLGSVGGGSANILGRAQTEVIDSTLEVTIESEPSTVLDRMYIDRAHRSLVLGAGPPGVGGGLDAQGFGLIVPAAKLVRGVGFGEREGRHMVTAVFDCGRFALDNSTAATAARSPWRWLWPL
jgi:hypothetical protein